MAGGYGEFEIWFKCMSGFTNENGKFIMPLQEKMSYKNSMNTCDSFGFINHFYDLKWLKVKFIINESITTSIIKTRLLLWKIKF